MGDRRLRVRTGEELLTRYLGGLGPDLSRPADPVAVAAAKWLYYVAATDDALFRDHGPLDGWPHAAGSVGVNPIYEQDGERLSFRFPSPWFVEENAGMRDYMPLSVSLRDEEDAGLLARAVLIGLPERYARPTGRPWTLRANRALTHLLFGSSTSGGPR
jgi:hypothetical protein